MGLMYYIGSMGIFLLSLLKLTPAKPQGRGVVEALKSIFNHKGAPTFHSHCPQIQVKACLSPMKLTGDSLGESSPTTDSHTPRKSLCDEIHVASPHHPAGKPFTPNLSLPDQSTLATDDVTVIHITTQSDTAPTSTLTTQTSDSQSTLNTQTSDSQSTLTLKHQTSSQTRTLTFQQVAQLSYSIILSS